MRERYYRSSRCASHTGNALFYSYFWNSISNLPTAHDIDFIEDEDDDDSDEFFMPPK